MNNIVLNRKLDKRPLLKNTELYALQDEESGRFVSRTNVMSEGDHADTIVTEKAKDARRFLGSFLNTTSWDWHAFYVELNLKELNALIAKDGAKAKK